MTDGSANDALKTLLRGVAHNDWHTVRGAWRGLIELGPQSVPAIDRMLNSGDWQSWTNTIEGRYLAVLLGLLQEIDIPAAQKAIANLRSTGLHAAHARIVALIEERMADTPREANISGVPVFLSRDLADHGEIVWRMTRWLAAPPPVNLDGILRIDVVPDQPEFDYLGLHNYAFSGIVLTWPKREKNWFWRANAMFRVERTLYHEIGHHALGHSEGGQVPQQEDEANQYARRHLRRAHPVMTVTVYLFLWPVALFRYFKRKNDGAQQT